MITVLIIVKYYVIIRFNRYLESLHNNFIIKIFIIHNLILQRLYKNLFAYLSFSLILKIDYNNNILDQKYKIH